MSATAGIRRRLRPLIEILRSSDARRDLRWELRRRVRGEPSLPEGPIRNVLVICLGNICRSPFAERLLAAVCPDLHVRSAGFEARDGDPAEPDAIRVASEFGVDLSDHAAHRITLADLAWADLIVGMTGRHCGMLQDRWPEHAPKHRLLGDFLAASPHAIADPWGCAAAEFRLVYRQIQLATTRLSACLATERLEPSPAARRTPNPGSA